MKVRQLSLEIENQPGRIFRIIEMLSQAEVQVIAISVSENAVSGVVRMVVQDLPTARQVLMDHEIPATVDEVLALSSGSESGSIARLLEPLHNERLNVQYLYALPGHGAGSMDLIVSVHDIDRAVDVLQQAGVRASTVIEGSR